MQSKDRLAFTFQTHTGSPTGYAESATVLMSELIRSGCEVHYQALGDDYIYETPTYDLMVNSMRAIEPEDDLVRVCYGPAPMFHGNAGKYKVGWTMIEVDRITERWVRACNKMDEVWVPTPLQKTIFEHSGVKVPVYVVPIAINTEQFRPDFVPAVYHGEHKFRFITSSFWQLRKRFDILIIAFAEEFAGEKDVGLIIKTLTMQPMEEILGQVSTWVGHRLDDQLAIVEGAFPWWEYVMMMRSAHAFVLPTAGEGYGCPPVQALACGLPVIVSDCMGPGEVLRDDGGQPFPGVKFLPCEKAPCEVHHDYYEGSNWWVPDIRDIRAAMREVYTNYVKWGLDAQVGAQMVRSLRSPAAAAGIVKDQLRRIYGNMDSGKGV